MREATRRATPEGAAASVEVMAAAAVADADPVAVLRSLLVGAGVFPRIADTLLESPAVLGMTPAAMAAEIAAASAVAAGGPAGGLLVNRLRRMAPKGLLSGKGRGVDRAARTQQTRSSGPERGRSGSDAEAGLDWRVPKHFDLSGAVPFLSYLDRRDGSLSGKGGKCFEGVRIRPGDKIRGHVEQVVEAVRKGVIDRDQLVEDLAETREVCAKPGQEIADEDFVAIRLVELARAELDEPVATAEERAAIREAMEWKQALDQAMQEKTPQDIEPFRVWSAMNDGRRLEIEVKPGEAIGQPVRMIAVWLRQDPALRVSLQDHRRDLRHPDRELSEQQAAVGERVLDLVAATLLDKPPARRATPEEQAAERARAARERQRAAALDEKTPSDMKPFRLWTMTAEIGFRVVVIEVKPFQRVGVFVDQIVEAVRKGIGTRERAVEARERIELAGKMPADQKRVGLAILDLALEILDEPPAAPEAEAVEAAVAPQRPERPAEPPAPPPDYNPVKVLRALQTATSGTQQASGEVEPPAPEAVGEVAGESPPLRLVGDAEEPAAEAGQAEEQVAAGSRRRRKGGAA